MELLDVLALRQSVRAYKNEPVEKELVGTVLMAGSMAPVGMGQYKNIHMTVVTNTDLLAKIDAATAAMMGRADAHPLYGVPILIIVSCKPGMPPIPGIAPANCGCIMENMMLQATEAGLGSVYLLAATEALAKDADIVAALGLPEGFVPTASLGLGWPAAELQPREMTFKIEMNSVD